MTFPEKLRQLREAAGLSEARLADACGLPFGTVHDYGLGRRTPSFPNVLKLAQALGTDCTAFAVCEDMTAKMPVAKKSSQRRRPTK